MILRAHHLICILGFRGLGYSKEYVANMSKIVGQLCSSPETLIQVVSKPDDICALAIFLGIVNDKKEGLNPRRR